MNTAAAIRAMLASGLTLEQALIAIEAMEQASAPAEKPRSTAADRQRRYRERKAGRSTDENRNAVTPVTSQPSRDVTDVTSVTPVTPENVDPRARVLYGEDNLYILPPSNPPPTVTVTERDQGREGKGNISRIFRDLVAAYPKAAHSQPKVEGAIAGLPEAVWPDLLAAARSYASEYRAKPTTHPIALDRFIREGVFSNYSPKSTGPPKVFVERGTPEWDRRVRAGHKPTLAQEVKIEGRTVTGWYFPADQGSAA